MTPEQNVIIWARGLLGREFVWGETDCVMLTLKAMDIFHGGEYAERFRGKWSNQEEALAYYDITSPSEMLPAYGGQRVLGTFAVLGDIITVTSEEWPERCHFVLGARSLSSTEDGGVSLIPTRFLTNLPDAIVWRVPCQPQSR